MTQPPDNRTCAECKWCGLSIQNVNGGTWIHLLADLGHEAEPVFEEPKCGAVTFERHTCKRAPGHGGCHSDTSGGGWTGGTTYRWDTPAESPNDAEDERNMREDITFDARRALNEIDPLVKAIERKEIEEDVVTDRAAVLRLFWGYRRAILIALERAAAPVKDDSTDPEGTRG
jgi:hypothetical protein